MGNKFHMGLAGTASASTLVGLLLCHAPSFAQGDPPTPLSILELRAPSGNERFGMSVSFDGNQILVGQRLQPDFPPGTAYLFDAATGLLKQTFVEPNTTFSSSFGADVAIDGEIVLVADRFARHPIPNASNGGSGSVYIYSATSGELLRTVNNPASETPRGEDDFGRAIDLDGRWAVVSRGINPPPFSSADDSRAYLIDVTTGAIATTFVNPRPAPDFNVGDFGRTVGISGRNVVVGNPMFDRGQEGAGFGTGEAYLFDAFTGSLLHTLSNPTPDESDLFGNSVAISGNNVLVGESTGNAVYVFDATTGAHIQTLEPPSEPDRGQLFGATAQSLAIEGNLALVGAGFDGTFGLLNGAAYLYDITTGERLLDLGRPSVEQNLSSVGHSVALSTELIVAGAPAGSLIVPSSKSRVLVYETGFVATSQVQGVFANQVIYLEDPDPEVDGLEAQKLLLLGQPDGQILDLDAGGTTLGFAETPENSDWFVNVPVGTDLIIASDAVADLPLSVMWGKNAGPDEDEDGIPSSGFMGEGELILTDAVPGGPWGIPHQNLFFYRLQGFDGPVDDIFISIDAAPGLPAGDVEIDSVFIVIPEPASLAFLAFGGLTILRRRMA